MDGGLAVTEGQRHIRVHQSEPAQELDETARPRTLLGLNTMHWFLCDKYLLGIDLMGWALRPAALDRYIRHLVALAVPSGIEGTGLEVPVEVGVARVQPAGEE